MHKHIEYIVMNESPLLYLLYDDDNERRHDYIYSTTYLENDTTAKTKEHTMTTESIDVSPQALHRARLEYYKTIQLESSHLSNVNASNASPITTPRE